MKLYFFYNLKFKNKKVDDWYVRVIVRMANIILPLYYYLTGLFMSAKIGSSVNLNESSKYIVSLTSFPKRIGYVWLTIESILRQTSKPDAIILWLAESEFKSKHSLPKKLLNLENRGLQIRFCEEDLKPHKKYYYTLKNYPRANLITIDDDVIYPSSMIAQLKHYHKQYPQSICSILTRTIRVEDDVIQPYRSWGIDGEFARSHKYLQIGVGGVLYPTGSLHPEVLNKKILTHKALKADDLWLKVMAVKNDTEILSLGHIYPRTFIPIIIKDNTQLMESNVHLGQNNKIINSLLDYYALREKILKAVKGVKCPNREKLINP